MSRKRAIEKLDVYVQRLIKHAQADVTDPFFRQSLVTIRDCYGQEWQNDINSVRKDLETGTEQVLAERENHYRAMAQEMRSSWYDEDWQETRSGYPFEAKFYETLADICHTGYEKENDQ